MVISFPRIEQTLTYSTEPVTSSIVSTKNTRRFLEVLSTPNMFLRAQWPFRIFLLFIFLRFVLALPSWATAGGPQVTLVGLEITQAIQGLDPTDPWNSASSSSNNVTLIANRKTYVRAYFDFNDSATGSIAFSGNIVGSLNGAILPIQSSLGAVVVNFNENGQLTSKRVNFSKSLNFELPDAWVGNAGTLQFSVQIIGSVSCIDSQGQNCSNRSITVGLWPPKPLRVQLVVLVEEDNDGDPLPISTPTDTGLIKSWLKRAYPIQNIGSAADSYFSEGVHHLTYRISSCDQANNELAVYRLGQIKSGSYDTRTRLVGLFSNANHPPGFDLSGCAVGVLPSGASDPQLFVSVPTGSVIPNSWNSAGNWDTDGSYADWYTGHELAHSFGFRHLHFCGAPAASAPPDYDTPPFNSSSYAGEISDAQGTYVGFDVGNLGAPIIGANAAGTSLKPLPGTIWHDIRTYCDKRWISSAVYEGIRQALDLENPDSVPPAAPTNLRVTKDEKEKHLDFNDRKELTWGPQFAPRSHSIPATSPFYPSSYNSYLRPETLRKFVSTYIQGRQGAQHGNTLLVNSESISRLNASEVTVREGDFLAVVATVNLTQKTATFRSTARVSRAEFLVLPDAAESGAKLQLIDDNDEMFAEKPLFVRRNTRMNDSEDETGLIYDAIELTPNKTFTSLKLFLAGKTEPAAVLQISKTPPRVTPPTPPFQAVEYMPGAVRFRWGAEDSDTDTKDLTYTIAISFDQGKTRHTLAVGRSKQQIVIGLNEFEFLSTKELDTVREARIEVIASDGFNTSEPLIETVLISRMRR